MAYTPTQAWIEIRNTGSRHVHLAEDCERIHPESAVTGPYLIGVASAGKGTAKCRCLRGTAHSDNGRRLRGEVSGGLPTLGRR